VVDSTGKQPPKRFEREKNKARAFARAKCQKSCNDEKFNRRKLVLREMMQMRGDHPKGSKHRCIIYYSDHFKSTQNGY
jgi:hypothetical protein